MREVIRVVHGELAVRRAVVGANARQRHAVLAGHRAVEVGDGLPHRRIVGAHIALERHRVVLGRDVVVVFFVVYPDLVDAEVLVHIPGSETIIGQVNICMGHIVPVGDAEAVRPAGAVVAAALGGHHAEVVVTYGRRRVPEGLGAVPLVIVVVPTLVVLVVELQLVVDAFRKHDAVGGRHGDAQLDGLARVGVRRRAALDARVAEVPGVRHVDIVPNAADVAAALDGRHADVVVAPAERRRERVAFLVVEAHVVISPLRQPLSIQGNLDARRDRAIQAAHGSARHAHAREREVVGGHDAELVAPSRRRLIVICPLGRNDSEPVVARLDRRRDGVALRIGVLEHVVLAELQLADSIQVHFSDRFHSRAGRDDRIVVIHARACEVIRVVHGESAVRRTVVGADSCQDNPVLAGHRAVEAGDGLPDRLVVRADVALERHRVVAGRESVYVIVFVPRPDLSDAEALVHAPGDERARVEFDVRAGQVEPVGNREAQIPRIREPTRSREIRNIASDIGGRAFQRRGFLGAKVVELVVVVVGHRVIRALD